jgi:hypothetical protein
MAKTTSLGRTLQPTSSPLTNKLMRIDDLNERMAALKSRKIDLEQKAVPGAYRGIYAKLIQVEHQIKATQKSIEREKSWLENSTR